MSGVLSPNQMDELVKQRLHAQISAHLAEIEGLFKPGLMELTFLARNKSNPNGHVLLTSEQDTRQIAKAIEQLMNQPDSTIVPPNR